MRPVLLIYERVTNKSLSNDTLSVEKIETSPSPIQNPRENKNGDEHIKKKIRLATSFPPPSTELFNVLNLSINKNTYAKPINNDKTRLPLSCYIFYYIVKKYFEIQYMHNENYVSNAELDIYDHIIDLLFQAVKKVIEMHKKNIVLNNLQSDKEKNNFQHFNFTDIDHEYVDLFLELDNVELSLIHVDFDLTLPTEKPTVYLVENKPKDKIVTPKGVDLYVLIRDFYFAVDCARINFLKFYSSFDIKYIKCTSLIFYKLSDLLKNWHTDLYLKTPILKENITEGKINIFGNLFNTRKSILPNMPKDEKGLFYIGENIIKKGTILGTYLEPKKKSTFCSFDEFIQKLAVNKNKEEFKNNLNICLNYSSSIYDWQFEDGKEIETNYLTEKILCPFEITTKGNIKKTNNLLPIQKSQYMNDGQGNTDSTLRKENNCKFYEKEILVIKDIKKNDELYAEYGEGYWASQDHNYLKYETEYLEKIIDEDIFTKLKKLFDDREKEVNEIRQKLITTPIIQ